MLESLLKWEQGAGWGAERCGQWGSLAEAGRPGVPHPHRYTQAEFMPVAALSPGWQAACSAGS